MKEHYDFRQGKRGAVVQTPPGKERITIRLDRDIVEWFRDRAEAAGGGNYQTQINQALREHIRRQQEQAMLTQYGAIEDTLRRVIREEVPALVAHGSSEQTNEQEMSDG